MVRSPLLELWGLQARGEGRGRGESWGSSAHPAGSSELRGTCCDFRKAGPASGRGGGQGAAAGPRAAYPAPPCRLGFAQALRSTELTVSVVTSGNSQRGRGKGLEEGTSAPGPQFPSYQHPLHPSGSTCCFVFPFGKEGIPCLWDVPGNNHSNGNPATPCRSSSQGLWLLASHPTPHPTLEIGVSFVLT